MTDTASERYTQHGLRPLVNFLQQARTHYLEQYRSFIENHRMAGNAGEPEVLLEAEDAALFDGLLVADYLITDADPRVVRFEPSRMLSFKPITVTITGMDIVIERLRWDDVVVLSDVDLPSKGDLQVWFEDWTTPREGEDEHREALANVLHSFRFEDGQFRIDFGSAPPKAVIDLFLLLNESGAKSVRLV
ncbi:hypothetical protein [Asticcacaulis sp.]|jgi:hypothetical protein|uniref:hypothetical protein n=1 Tax=Asticcacaulis sp. TaxID=1872648 RepID=UPI0031D7C3EC